MNELMLFTKEKQARYRHISLFMVLTIKPYPMKRVKHHHLHLFHSIPQQSLRIQTQ